MVSTTKWSMWASGPGEKSCPAGQFGGCCGTNMFRGPVYETTMLASGIPSSGLAFWIPISWMMLLLSSTSLSSSAIPPSSRDVTVR